MIPGIGEAHTSTGGKMPFQNTVAYHFNERTINTIIEGGGVYGLARPRLSHSGYYTILYVGKSGNLRERLRSHLNNPPTAGVTHFFTEAIQAEAPRTRREVQLITEFDPIGNTQLK